MMYNQPPFLTFNCPPHLSYIQGLDRSAKPNPCSKSSPVMNLILYFFSLQYMTPLRIQQPQKSFSPRIGWARPSSSQTATVFKETKFRFAASVTHGMDCLLFECKLPLITRPPPIHIRKPSIPESTSWQRTWEHNIQKKKKIFFSTYISLTYK